MLCLLHSTLLIWEHLYAASVHIHLEIPSQIAYKITLSLLNKNISSVLGSTEKYIYLYTFV